jgi:C-terminal processing protease CtpA/Prc
MARHAESTVDTYDAIRFALASLGDHHSSFHLTKSLEQLEAERKGHPVSSEPESKTPMSPFVRRYEPEGTSVSAGSRHFALIVVPKCFPENDKQFVQYETRLQQLLASLDATHPDGWIVDLRGNVGGNMWPMLAGIGPLLGESDDLGEFFTTSGHSVWTYRAGVASEVDDKGKQYAYPKIEGVPYSIKGTPKVAVLIDSWTGSSGEAVAIALRGRPQTRFFGEHTQGASTVNETVDLPDGASMWLTIGVAADRTGKQYLKGIDPDEVVRETGQAVSGDHDPVVQHAIAWLSIGG